MPEILAVVSFGTCRDNVLYIASFSAVLSSFPFWFFSQLCFHPLGAHVVCTHYIALLWSRRRQTDVLPTYVPVVSCGIVGLVLCYRALNLVVAFFGVSFVRARGLDLIKTKRIDV